MKPRNRSQLVYLPPSLEECFTEALPRNARASRTLAGIVATLKVYGSRWVRRYRLRQSLREMDSYRVEKDIGVPMGYLSEEANKPFWRE